METELPSLWPKEERKEEKGERGIKRKKGRGWEGQGFVDPSLPLFLDIGSGKGGFLLDLGEKHLKEEEKEGKREGEGERKLNYLGLEIRPRVVEYARGRVGERGLGGRVGFVGCNANVDLERVVGRYRKEGGELECVTILVFFFFLMFMCLSRGRKFLSYLFTHFSFF